MSTTFQKAPKAVYEMAKSVLNQHETHKPLLSAEVTTDFVMAYAEIDEKTNKPKGHPIVKKGQWIKAEARKLGLKDRAMGRGDTEILIDGDWWAQASEDEQRALLDHELHHFAVKIDKRGIVLDDLMRPVIQIRYHDAEFGWFKIIAERNGMASQERQQSAAIMCDMGQYFWPAISKLVESNPKLLA